MTKPKFDYPGRIQKRHPSPREIAVLDSKILAVLAINQAQSVNALAARLDFAKNTIRAHLRAMEIDGKVTGIRDAGVRPQLWKVSNRPRRDISDARQSLAVGPFAALFASARQEAA